MNIPVFSVCSTGSGISPPLQIKSCIKNCHFCIPVSSNLTCRLSLASFPGPARLSLAVRNSLRGPGLVHHVMSATVVFLRH